MTDLDLYTLRFCGAIRAKGHTDSEAVLAAEWKAVDRVKVRAAARMAAAVQPALVAAARDAAVRMDRYRPSMKAAPGDPVTGAAAYAVDLAALAAAVSDVLTVQVIEAMRAGWATGMARIDARLPFDASRDAVRRESARLLELAESVPETLRSRLDTIIRDGLAAGLEGPAIGDLIRAAAPDLTARQAQTIGRTTATGAFEAGQVAGFAEAGIESKRWLSMRDDRVRDEHEALDGEEVPVGDAFSNGREYPGEPNCRCTVLPVTVRKAALRGRPWLADRNAAIVRDYPALRDAHGKAIACDKLAEVHGISPDRVYDVWKARRR